MQLALDVLPAGPVAFTGHFKQLPAPYQSLYVPLSQEMQLYDDGTEMVPGNKQMHGTNRQESRAMNCSIAAPIILSAAPP
jgi:hypothetical protein